MINIYVGHNVHAKRGGENEKECSMVYAEKEIRESRYTKQK